MKILQVNCVYRKGSTGKITHDLHEGLLNHEIKSVVCYGRGELKKEENVYKTCSEWYSKLNHLKAKCDGIMYGGCLYSTKKLFSIIEKEKPDIVHLQCINGYFVNIYKLVKWLKINHIKTVLTLHAEFMYTANCGYAFDCKKWQSGCGNCPRKKEETDSFFIDGTNKSWKKMKASFDGFGDLVVVSVSPWLMHRAEQSAILKEKKHFTIYNGLDTATFHPYEMKSRDRKIVFHASPCFTDIPGHNKGGFFVLDLAKRMPEVDFVVAGNYFVAGQIPENVKLLGKIVDQNKLAELYSVADLTLITSRCETFSMICAESLCCGTPVVGFKAGAPEQISLIEFSEFVDYSDLDALEYAVKKWIHKAKSTAIAEKAANVYDKKIMVNKYINLYKELEEGRL